MESPINRLKSRVLSKKGGRPGTALTELLFMIREFSCLGDILGRDFEVRDSKGKLVYTIRQKPWAMTQVEALRKECRVLKELDADIEKEKWGSKGKK